MSQTATIELQDFQHEYRHVKTLEPPAQTYRRVSTSTKEPREWITDRRIASQDVLPIPGPSDPVQDAPAWNSSRGNIFRVSCCFYALFMMGANDAAYGALIPYLERYYGLSYTIVSLIFLSPAIGYILAALSNNIVHMKLGQRGIAFIGPICKVVAYTVISVHPPYGVLVFVYIFVGYGIGLGDAGWNAYIGDMANTNQLMGVLHGFYGLGATVSPLIATSLITKAHWPWFAYYYILLGGVVLELVVCMLAFWDCNASAYRASVASSADAHDSNNSSTASLKDVLFRRPAARITWLCAFFLLGYMGVEVSLGGWIVTFMNRVRDGTPFASGIVATGFWLGLTLGRVTLGFITPKIGEKLAISIYLPIVMALQLCFWLIPSFISSAIFVALEGFFLGPLFPAAIIATTKLLPKHLHVSAVGFATAFGGCGAAVLPFAVGAVAGATSVNSLQPMVLGMLAFVLAAWLGLPKIRKRD